MEETTENQKQVEIKKPESNPLDSQQRFKRNVAYKFRIGEILKGSPVIENERLKHISINDKEVVRTNIIANVIDKFIQDGEKKFGSITLDDATGQIKAKVFGEEIERFSELNQGDTLMVIGLLRSWNNEIYLTPEIIKKKSPEFLLVRKLESDINAPKTISSEESSEIKDQILSMIKAAEENEGIFVDKIILEIKATPDTINSEIKKLLENGLIYEPRPGKLRYLG